MTKETSRGETNASRSALVEEARIRGNDPAPDTSLSRPVSTAGGGGGGGRETGYTSRPPFSTAPRTETPLICRDSTSTHSAALTGWEVMKDRRTNTEMDMAVPTLKMADLKDH